MSLAIAKDESPEKLLERAVRLHDAQDLDRVAPLLDQVLAHPRISLDQRLDAHLLRGCTLAVIGDPTEAEASFRLLLRAWPAFDMPADMPPKILAVFRKVQFEERILHERLGEIEHTRLVHSLALSGDYPKQGRGGLPVVFDYSLRDPHGAVVSMEVRYRRPGQASFSAVTLEPDAAGRWRGQIPGEMTQSDSGSTLEYIVATRDQHGDDLLVVGSPKEPSLMQLDPGSVPSASPPFYKTAWFWAVAGAALVGSGTVLWVMRKQAASPPPTDLGEIPLD